MYDARGLSQVRVLARSSSNHLNMRSNVAPNPLPEITGYGSTGDAYHMTAPDPEGAGIVRSMRQALEEGGFAPADIGHVNAHGTGYACKRQDRVNRPVRAVR